MAQRRKRSHVHLRIRRGEAQPGFRQAPDLLGEMGFLCLRQRPGVGDQVIHGGNPGGGKITQPTGLHRRRLPGKHGQAVVRGVSGQVDQDINALVVYPPGKRFVGQPQRRMPATTTSFDPLGQCVAAKMAGVGNEFQPTGGVGCQRSQHAFCKVAHRMIAQIAGHQANTQASVSFRNALPAGIWACLPRYQFAKAPGFGQ